MEDEKLEKVETVEEPTEEQTPEPTQQQATDLSAVLEAIADLKQVITTALTQVEPETVATEALEDETPEENEPSDIPEQDVDEISRQLGF